MEALKPVLYLWWRVIATRLYFNLVSCFMKYIAIILFVLFAATSAQAQCPDTCHTSGNPAPPSGSYFIMDENPSQSYQGTCPTSEEQCDGSTCTDCRDIQFLYRGCCPLQELIFHFEGCVQICAEVVIPTYPAWDSDHEECFRGQVKVSTPNSSDALQTCKWIRLRVCAPHGTLSGMSFQISGSDCNGNPNAILYQDTLS